VSVPPRAVTQPTEVAITRLDPLVERTTDPPARDAVEGGTLHGGVPALDAGLVNVTPGQGAYELTPHGQTFATDVTVTLPYDEQLIPEGMGAEDVTTFFFDEEARRWKSLRRARLELASSTVESLSNHFTTMINAVVVAPEHPEIAAFNPSSIRDLEVADPAAQINIMGPPSGSPMGDAQLSFPIEVPPGRRGMTPSVMLAYGSSGGSGWLGMGWSVPQSAIVVDTRWGVPRYDVTTESETYLLDGEQLVPFAHRGEVTLRTAEKLFHTRTEGAFRRILRHGSNPLDYWWEITDKTGARSFYGGTPETGALDSHRLKGPLGAGHFAIAQVRDTHDNRIVFEQRKAFASGTADGELGQEIYLEEIEYTTTQGEPGAYRVVFSSEIGRPDVSIDARLGFRRVLGERLRRVDVLYANSLVRSYLLAYSGGPSTRAC